MEKLQPNTTTQKTTRITKITRILDRANIGLILIIVVGSGYYTFRTYKEKQCQKKIGQYTARYITKILKEEDITAQQHRYLKQLNLLHQVIQQFTQKYGDDKEEREKSYRKYQHVFIHDARELIGRTMSLETPDTDISLTSAEENQWSDIKHVTHDLHHFLSKINTSMYDDTGSDAQNLSKPTNKNYKKQIINELINKYGKQVPLKAILDTIASFPYVTTGATKMGLNAFLSECNRECTGFTSAAKELAGYFGYELYSIGLQPKGKDIWGHQTIGIWIEDYPSSIPVHEREQYLRKQGVFLIPYKKSYLIIIEIQQHTSNDFANAYATSVLIKEYDISTISINGEGMNVCSCAFDNIKNLLKE